VKQVRWIVLGSVLGVLVWGLARLALEPWPEPPHYHANWSIIVDGQPLDLSGDRYMEDVAACAVGDQVTPAERVHMHNGEDHVVHVHHTGVAWGHLLDNLGFDAGHDYLILGRDRRLFNRDGSTLKYVINGLPRDDISTAPIRSGDRLLISYGPESAEEVLAEQFPDVPSGAEGYDTRQDPAGCAGAAERGIRERLRRAFWG
jgi:hypothetical protein